MGIISENISNPFSTGGGGIFFENQVQTMFVVIMLACGYIPCLPGEKITKIKFQCKNIGFCTDDMVIYANDTSTTKEHKMLTQIKHKISITNSDKDFQAVINAAWNDFNNPSVFNKENDIIVLITGPLSKSDIYDTRVILDWARHSEDPNDYFENKIGLSKICSDKKRKKIEIFRKALKAANKDRDVSNELIYSFLRHFYILGYDLDIKDGSAYSFYTTIINQLTNIENGNCIWSKIAEMVSSYNKNAGTLEIDNLPDEIKEYVKKREVNIIPENFVKPKKQFIEGVDQCYENSLFIASILGEWNENSQGDNEIIREVTDGF